MNSKNNIILSAAVLLSIIFLFTGCNAPEPGIDNANVTEIDILILESFPVQVHVVAKGYLPNPCTQIDEIIKSREGNDFTVTIKTQTSPGPCIQVIKPFEETISLDDYGLSAGTYNVNVNGIEDSFTLDVDNIPRRYKNIFSNILANSSASTLSSFLKSYIRPPKTIFNCIWTRYYIRDTV